MNWPWSELGLDGPTSLNEVRQAYARRLKETHPEEDPEGFQRLHTAYQTIRKLVQGAEPNCLEEPQPQKQPVAQHATGAALSSELLEVIQRNPMEDHPAVAAFQALYTGTKRRERTQWDLYFTGPEFLSVWRDGEFTALLAQIVMEHKATCPPSKAFQTALAVAYQMEPVSGPDGVEFYPAPGMSFEGIEAICAIVALGPSVGPLRGNDRVLASAYGDYWQLLEMAERGWTDEDLCQLDSLLWKYTTPYVKEKCTGDQNNERNVISLRLLNHFFAQEGLPAEVYQVLWNRFDLNAALFGRAKVLHGTLRELCLERAPEICGVRENLTELTKAYDAITYHQKVGEEEMRRQVDALFARADFRRAVSNRTFMQNHTFWSGMAAGDYFLHRLIALYEEHPELPLARSMKESAQGTLRSLEEASRREAEEQRLHQLAQEEITPDCGTLSNPLFFRWYLQAAFFQAENPEGDALMHTVEQALPSLPQWNQRLAEQGMSSTLVLHLPEGETWETVELTALFHQFYIEYQLDGRPLSQPILPFWNLEEAEDDPFFLLLPMTAAFPSELEQVTDCIQKRLARLGLCSEKVLPILARAMAWEVACLREEGEDVVVARPAFFPREVDGVLCFCQWYSWNSRLLTIRRTPTGLELLEEYCREEVSTLQQAEALAEEILDTLFAPEQDVILSKGFPYQIQAEFFQAPSRTWAPEEVDHTLIERLLQDFQNKQIHRLAFTAPPAAPG